MSDAGLLWRRPRRRSRGYLAAYLTQQHAHAALALTRYARTPEQLLTVRAVLAQVGELADRIHELDGLAEDRQAILEAVADRAERFADLVGRATIVDHRLAAWLMKVVQEIFRYEALVGGPATRDPASGNEASATEDRRAFESQPVDSRRRLIVPSELLYAEYAAAMPPERMAVVAGRRTGNTVTLAAAWDVTGDCSVGHCRADPNKLPRALSAMGATGSYLALWLHSHPGDGADWTRPSSIDVRQHADWIADYSPYLISAIAASDGFVRLWGTAVTDGSVDIDLVGDGVSRLATSDGTVLLRLTRTN